MFTLAFVESLVHVTLENMEGVGIEEPQTLSSQGSIRSQLDFLASIMGLCFRCQAQPPKQKERATIVWRFLNKSLVQLEKLKLWDTKM